MGVTFIGGILPLGVELVRAFRERWAEYECDTCSRRFVWRREEVDDSEGEPCPLRFTDLLCKGKLRSR